MSVPRSSIDQWAVLASVIDQGGFAGAAASLHRSQSAISYALARLQEELQVRLLTLEGRRAVLTDEGRALLKRARPLLQEMQTLERLAHSLRTGWESSLSLVVDAAFPREVLLKIIGELRRTCSNTEINLSDSVLSGAEQAIIEHAADLVVTSRVPPGFLGEYLLDVEFIALARSDHPLLQLDRTLAAEDLVRHVQIVVRDSGTRAPRDEGWLGAERRCTVSSPEASLALIEAGLGFGWLPAHLAAASLEHGALRRLPLRAGGIRKLSLQLVAVHPEPVGPALRAAIECFQRCRNPAATPS